MQYTQEEINRLRQDAIRRTNEMYAKSLNKNKIRQNEPEIVNNIQVDIENIGIKENFIQADIEENVNFKAEKIKNMEFLRKTDGGEFFKNPPPVFNSANKHSHPSHHIPPNIPDFSKSPPLFNGKNDIIGEVLRGFRLDTLDKDKLILLALMYLLYKEKADFKLILALLYVFL
jgi:hypothetical protein